MNPHPVLAIELLRRYGRWWGAREKRNDMSEPTPPQPMPYPIRLTIEQQEVIQKWAADDRLWTTQETVEFNLSTIARKLIATERAAREQEAAEMAKLREWFKNSYDIEHCEFSPQEWQQWRDIYKDRAEKAEREVAELKGRLSHAEQDSKRLDFLNSVEGMDWFSNCDYGDATREAIDAQLSAPAREEGK